MSAFLARKPVLHHGVLSGPCSITAPITGLPEGTLARVVLLHAASEQVARVVTTGGPAVFEKLAAEEWIVLARDTSGAFNAVVADRVVTTLPA